MGFRSSDCDGYSTYVTDQYSVLTGGYLLHAGAAMYRRKFLAAVAQPLEVNGMLSISIYLQNEVASSHAHNGAVSSLLFHRLIDEHVKQCQAALSFSARRQYPTTTVDLGARVKATIRPSCRKARSRARSLEELMPTNGLRSCLPLVEGTFSCPLLASIFLGMTRACASFSLLLTLLDISQIVPKDHLFSG
ncbi:hypothetical protein KCU81_g878, partial [Aureobasidium melanogenum]